MMKKSSVLGVLAAVILSLFLTGCESVEEKQARLQEIRRLEARIISLETNIQNNKQLLGVYASPGYKDDAYYQREAKELENTVKENEEEIQEVRTKLQKLQK
jgi:outer membrane murein-binding lipoprotein Lpp